MTPIVMVDELVLFIQNIVANFELQTNVKNAPHKAPQVIGGYLNEKKPGDKQDPPDFPWVIVRYLEDDDTDADDMARVRIIAGTYSDDTKDGWRDALNVITRIKTALLEERFFGGAFKVERPIKTELPEEQPFPEWIAILTISVTIPQIQQEGGFFKDA